MVDPDRYLSKDLSEAWRRSQEPAWVKQARARLNSKSPKSSVPTPVSSLSGSSGSSIDWLSELQKPQWAKDFLAGSGGPASSEGSSGFPSFTTPKFDIPNFQWPSRAGNNNGPGTPFIQPPGGSGPNGNNALDSFRAGERESFGSSVSGGISETPPNRLQQLMDEWHRNTANAGEFTPPDINSFEPMARERAEAMMRQQYDPLIRMVQENMRAAERRGGKGKKEIKGMYEALSDDYKTQLGKTTTSYKNKKSEEAARTKELKKNIASEYAGRQREQMNLMRSLGIEQAAAETIPEQNEDRSYFTSLADTEGAEEERYLGELQAADENYQRSGITSATLEGNNRVADLMGQLEEYLQQGQNQIGTYAGQKQAGITSNTIDFQNQLLQNAAQQGQWAAGMDMQRQGLLLQGIGQEADIINQQTQRALEALKAARGGGGGSGDLATKGYEGAANIFAQQAGNLSRSPDEMMAIFNQVYLNNHNIRQGKIQLTYPPGHEKAGERIFDRITGDPVFADMSPEQATYEARTAAEQMGFKLTPKEINALTQAVLAMQSKNQ